MAIFVEILIHAPMEVLWRHTQTPELHQRWDLRFTEIIYLPRTDPAEPQRFLYATRVGLVIEISGEGESLAESDLPDGSRTSSLKFSSSDPRSIIREGSGYWKYAPAGDAVRFLTWYDYQPRFGPTGALFDKVIFRPMMGWATAWSFDRLRLWLEDGLDPSQALRNALIHLLARVGVGFIFFYHGLVPKLLAPDPDEIAMLRDAGVTAAEIGWVLPLLGAAEIALAIALLLFWQRRAPVIFVLVLMILGIIGISITSPRYLAAAFNPISLNLAVAALAAIDLIVLGHVPSARRCRRQPTEARS